METVNLLFITTAEIAVFIPVVIAIITSFAAPYYLSKRKDSADLNVSMLKEQTEYRRDLQERIDKLEHRLEGAGKALNSALDAVRELKSENERCSREIATLRKELEAANKRIRERLHDLDGLNGDKNGFVQEQT
jgi:peptidoglycan hydrolase CwlO-like protein